MNKNKKEYVESGRIKEINKIAEEAFRAKEEGDIHRRKKLVNKMTKPVLEELRNVYYKGLSSSDIESCGGELFIECISKWQPGQASFWAYYKSLLNNRMIDERNKQMDKSERIAKRRRKDYIKAHPELTPEQLSALKDEIVRVDFYSEPEDDVPERDYAAEDDTENAAIQSDAICDIFNVLNNAVMSRKKQYENSPKICYPVYFYTEFVTKRVSREPNANVFSKAENGIMKAIDHDFASFYLNGDNNSIVGIARSRLKPISDFKDNSDDSSPCGYDIQNIVYIKYLSSLKKSDKQQSESSITQQRSKFMKLIQDAVIEDMKQ